MINKIMLLIDRQKWGREWVQVFPSSNIPSVREYDIQELIMLGEYFQ